MINIREAYATAARNGMTPQPEDRGRTIRSEEAQTATTVTLETGSHAGQYAPSKAAKDITGAFNQRKRTAAPAGLIEKPSRWGDSGTSLVGSFFGDGY